MKKIILMILITFIGIFTFNSNVEAKYTSAKCSGSTAKCVYELGNATLTVNYSNRKISASCTASSASASGGYGASCDTAALSQNYFVNDTTGELFCPSLYKTLNVNMSIKTYEYKITNTKVSSSTAVSKSSASISNKTCTEDNGGTNTNSGTCICGAVTLSGSETSISGYSGYTMYRSSGLKYSGGACPEAVTFTCNNVGSVKTCTVFSSTVADHGSKCNDSQALEDYNSGSGSNNDVDYNMPADSIASFCTETSRMWKIFGYLVNALKVLVPVIIIVMGSLDLGKAVTAQNEDDIKKGTQLLVKRIIAGVIIFFIPTIISIVFKMVAERSTYINSSGACIECITTPGSC